MCRIFEGTRWTRTLVHQIVPFLDDIRHILILGLTKEWLRLNLWDKARITCGWSFLYGNRFFQVRNDLLNNRNELRRFWRLSSYSLLDERLLLYGKLTPCFILYLVRQACCWSLIRLRCEVEFFIDEIELDICLRRCGQYRFLFSVLIDYPCVRVFFKWLEDRFHGQWTRINHRNHWSSIWITFQMLEHLQAFLDKMRVICHWLEWNFRFLYLWIEIFSVHDRVNVLKLFCLLLKIIMLIFFNFHLRIKKKT